MFIAACFTVAFSFLGFFFMFVMPPDTEEWTVWLLLFFCFFFLGSVAGRYAKDHAKTGVMFIGVLLGIFVGVGLYNMFIYNFFEGNNILGIWLTLMVSAIGVSTLCMTFFDNAVIFGSAVIGSYFFFRGVSVYAGGYPNEIVIYQDYVNNKMNEMPVSFLVYSAMIVATAGMSVLYQMKHRQSNAGSYSYAKKESTTTEHKYSRV